MDRQEYLLEQILLALNKPALGFHQDAGSIKIYCNRSNNCLWYKLVSGSPVAIQETSLTGYLKGLCFEKVERRGKEVHKLLTTIEADHEYILESGFDSHFSKCLLSAIAVLDRTQLQQPITIVVSPGDDEAVLFARVYAGKQYIKVSYDSDSDFRAIAKAAITNVRSI